jgi:hypothetical protein
MSKVSRKVNNAGLSSRDIIYLIFIAIGNLLALAYWITHYTEAWGRLVLGMLPYLVILAFFDMYAGIFYLPKYNPHGIAKIITYAVWLL